MSLLAKELLKDEDFKEGIINSLCDSENTYRTCTTCGNEMKLVRSSNGNYWICKVCNSTQIDY